MQFPSPAALIVIDVQQGFFDPCWGQRNNPDAERRIADLLGAWRARGWPLVHVRHASRSAQGVFRPGTPGYAFKPEALPLDGETVVVKHVNSGFIGTELERHLRERGIASLVLCGLTTDHCVSTTTRMAGNLGFDAVVVHDACATHERIGPDGRRFTAEEMHASALASLHGEFAQVAGCDAVLAALAAA